MPSGEYAEKLVSLIIFVFSCKTVEIYNISNKYIAGKNYTLDKDNFFSLTLLLLYIVTF